MLFGYDTARSCSLIKHAMRICLPNRDQTCSAAVVQIFKVTVKILKIGTPEIITIIVLHLERLDFTVQYCVQKMQTEYQIK